MKRMTAILLILSISVFVFSSCSGSSSVATTEKAVKTEAPEVTKTPSVSGSEVSEVPVSTGLPELFDDLPEDLYFDDDIITFAYAPGTTGTNFTMRSLIPDEDSGDEVDAAIHERNRKVESRLGVTLEIYEACTSGGLTDSVSVSLSAGDDEYDVICGYQYFDLGLSTMGYLVDLNDLSEYDADYIDLEKDYWAHDYMDQISYGNQRYWATGDIALRYMGEVSCVFLNTSLYDRALKATYGDIFEIVRSGKWTLDLMDKMCESVYEDSGIENDKTDIDDVLGFCNPSFEYFCIGAGVEFSKKNPDGTFTISINSPVAEAYSKLSNVMWNKRYNYASSGKNVNWEEGMMQFASGNVLFNLSEIFNAELCLRGMEDDYTILPLPKLYEYQEYRTSLGDNMTLFGISIHSDVIPAAAATLEALCAESYRSVRTVYYDQALKYKYTRDTNTAEMIELIRDSIYTDFAYAWSSRIDNIAFTFRPIGPANFASYMRKSESKYQGKVDSIIEDFKKLEKSK